jgi:hypothetical protein
MHLESTLPVLYYGCGRRVAAGGAQWPEIRWESADKPGSVVGNHSSGMHVTVHLKQPTRKLTRATRCGLATAVLPYLALLQAGFAVPSTVTGDAVRSYRTLSPLPALAGFGGLLSVALSVGSRPPGVTWRLALWSPDFPPLCMTKRRLPGRLPAAR